MRKLRGSKPALKRVDTQAARAWMPCCGRVGQSLQSRMPQEVDPAQNTQECEPSGVKARVRSRAHVCAPSPRDSRCPARLEEQVLQAGPWINM
eukprot:7135718-Pyramimonas_sp.AAC.1